MIGICIDNEQSGGNIQVGKYYKLKAHPKDHTQFLAKNDRGRWENYFRERFVLVNFSVYLSLLS